MTATRLILCAVLSVPAAWFAGLLADRVPAMGRDMDNNLRDPDALRLFDDLPGLRLHGRYLAIQLSMLVLYVATAYRFLDEPVLVLAPYIVWWCGFVAMSATDVLYRRLPDRIVLPTFVIGTVVMVAAALLTARATTIRYAFAAAGIYFALFLVLNLIYPGLAAFGDVKASAPIGMAVGFTALDVGQAAVLSFWGILIAFLLSAILGFGFIIAGGLKRARERRVGLGSYLVVGCFVVVMVGPALVGP